MDFMILKGKWAGFKVNNMKKTQRSLRVKLKLHS